MLETEASEMDDTQSSPSCAALTVVLVPEARVQRLPHKRRRDRISGDYLATWVA
jgi:hypothetical protein